MSQEGYDDLVDELQHMADQRNPFLSRPEIQILRRTLSACRHGKSGMNVQIPYHFHY